MPFLLHRSVSPMRFSLSMRGCVGDVLLVEALSLFCCRGLRITLSGSDRGEVRGFIDVQRRLRGGRRTDIRQ